MDNKTKEFLEGVFPYFKILDNINKNLTQLINNNVDNSPYENEELFYQISSDLIRIYPYRKFDKTIKIGTGILLLREYMPFLKDEYQSLLENDKCVQALNNILEIRNKYEHEPHNLRFAFSVGGKTSCSVSVHYKNKLLTLSTLWLTNIVYSLNKIFITIQDLYLQTIEECDSRYKEYPCYKTICSIDLVEYNKKYNYVPWEHIMIDNDIEVDFFNENE